MSHRDCLSEKTKLSGILEEFQEIRQKSLQMRQKSLQMRQKSVEMRQKNLEIHQTLKQLQIKKLTTLEQKLEQLHKLTADRSSLVPQETASLPSVLQWGDLCLNPATFEATYATKPLDLTAKEYRLLQLFLQNGGRVLSRDEFLQHLWSAEDTPQADTVKAHIKHLRQKLQAVGAPADLIETVYGVGYRLKKNPTIHKV